MSSFFKSLSRSPAIQTMAGRLLAGYFKLVHRTARITCAPSGDAAAHVRPLKPCIFVFWHGLHFMAPLTAQAQDLPMHSLVSRHGDGNIAAVMVESLGYRPIRGAGDRKGKPGGKGGAASFLAMLKALRKGESITVTGDIPKVGYEFSDGLVLLAQKSGRPIVPLAYRVRNRYVMPSWDRAELPFPFSRAGIVFGEPIFVKQDATPEELEQVRLQCQIMLDDVSARALALAEGRDA